MEQEVPRVATHWKRAELLDAYADAYRTVVGDEPSHAALAVLWAQATLECGRDGVACWQHNVGNLRGVGPTGLFTIVAGAYECARSIPVGAGEWNGAAACAPGDLPYLPAARQQRFAAYSTFVDACTAKLELVACRWPAALEALRVAKDVAASGAYVLGLREGPMSYFRADPSAYAAGVLALTADCLRTTSVEEWPVERLRDTVPAPYIEPMTIVQAADFVRALADDEPKGAAR